MKQIVDTTPLEHRVTRREARDFRTAMAESGNAGWGSLSVSGNATIAALIGGLTTVAVLLVVGIVWIFDRSPELLLLAAAGVAFGGLIMVAIFAMMNRDRRLSLWKRHLKCARFAERNQLVYRPERRGPWYPGLIFNLGNGAVTEAGMFSDDGPIAACGRYKWETGSGDDRKTHRWQYAAIRLPGTLPHIVLDARSNNRLGTNLPVAYRSDQRVSLGQPLDKHFTAYAPSGYGFDAYYIFTPDLIAYLVDASRAFDLEIVDDWLFVYSRSGLDITAPRTWQQLDWLAQTVGSRVGSRSESYRDHRVGEPAMDAPGLTPRPAPTGPPPQVAPRGRRLRTSVKWTAIVGGILYGIYVLISLIAKIAEWVG